MELRPISESWHRIESWLRDRERSRELASPATSQDIAWVEGRLSENLHPDHRQLLLGHNGSGSFTLPPHYEILSTSEVVDAWRIKTDVWGDHPRSPYHRHWVPFASDRAGGVLYLDVSRPANASVLTTRRAPLLSPHSMWASLPSLMHHAADALESGHRLDRYRRPSDEDDFLLWEVVLPDADDN